MLGGHELRAKRDGDGGKLGGGVGVGDAAADGAAVSDLEVTDVRNRRGEQWGGVLEHREALQGPHSCHRAYSQTPVGAFLDVRHARDAVEIYDDLGLGKPHVHQRHQALAPGQGLGVVAVLIEEARCPL